MLGCKHDPLADQQSKFAGRTRMSSWIQKAMAAKRSHPACRVTQHTNKQAPLCCHKKKTCKGIVTKGRVHSLQS